MLNGTGVMERMTARRWREGIFAAKNPKTMVHTFKLKESRLTNLRPVERCGEWGLEVAAPKKRLAAWTGWRPLVRLADGGREVWLFCKGSTLAGGELGEGSTPLPFENGTPGEVSGAVATGTSTALVICRRGSVEVSVAGGVWSCRATSRTYPAVSFRATTEASRSVVVGDRTMSQEFTGGTTLSPATRQAVCSDLAGAYENACAGAAADGVFTAPVLVWARYLDSRNRLLLTTPPVAVRATGTFSPWVETTVENLKTVKGYTLSVPCYGIEAEFDAESCPDVAAVEIYATPELHPYRSGRTGSVAITRSTGLRISLPGFEHDVTGSSSGAVCALRRIVGASPRMGRLVMRVERPFGGTTTTMRVHNVATGSPGADGAAVDTALGRGYAVPDAGRVLMESPHTFGADVVASDASAVVFAGIHSVRSRGFQPLFFASETTTASGSGARAMVTVTFSGTGRRGVVCSHEFKGKVPTKLGPVLSYPSPDATSMRITIFDGNATRSGAFALSPDPSGCRSVYIQAGLGAIELPTVSAALVSDVAEPSDDFDTLVAASAVGSPLEVLATKEMSAPLAEIAGAVGSDTAWEYGRSRFVGRGASGLISLTVDNGFKSLSAKTIDEREPHALCGGAGCVYAAVAGEVLAVGATSRKVQRVLEGEYTALAWDGQHRELLAINAEGSTALCVDSGTKYNRPELAGGSAMNAGGVHFVSLNGLHPVHEEDSACTSTVALESIYESGGRDFSPRRVCVHLSGFLEEGKVSLSAGGGRVCELSLSGNVRHPLVARLLHRRVQGLTFRLECSSDDLRITSVKVQ